MRLVLKNKSREVLVVCLPCLAHTVWMPLLVFEQVMISGCNAGILSPHKTVYHEWALTWRRAEQRWLVHAALRFEITRTIWVSGSSWLLIAAMRASKLVPEPEMRTVSLVIWGVIAGFLSENKSKSGTSINDDMYVDGEIGTWGVTSRLS